jgi:hypothetical protein
MENKGKECWWSIGGCVGYGWGTEDEARELAEYLGSKKNEAPMPFERCPMNEHGDPLDEFDEIIDEDGRWDIDDAMAENLERDELADKADEYGRRACVLAGGAGSVKSYQL